MKIFDLVENKFNDRDISTEVILPNIKLLTSSSKESPEFLDPKYFPFYYRLGCEIQPKKIIQIGSKLGLIASSFLKGCKSVEEWHFFDDTKPAINIIKSNLTINGCSNCFFKYPINLEYNNNIFFDLAFLSQSYDSNNELSYMKFLWNALKSGGVLVVDYLFDKNVSECFNDFCLIKNRTPKIIKTRYGVGIIVKQ